MADNSNRTTEPRSPPPLAFFPAFSKNVELHLKILRDHVESALEHRFKNAGYLHRKSRGGDRGEAQGRDQVRAFDEIQTAATESESSADHTHGAKASAGADVKNRAPEERRFHPRARSRPHRRSTGSSAGQREALIREELGGRTTGVGYNRSWGW
eukprot:6176403-Pleurochrysis_carterae.AAC.2